MGVSAIAYDIKNLTSVFSDQDWPTLLEVVGTGFFGFLGHQFLTLLFHIEKAAVGTFYKRAFDILISFLFQILLFQVKSRRLRIFVLRERYISSSSNLLMSIQNVLGGAYPSQCFGCRTDWIGNWNPRRQENIGWKKNGTIVWGWVTIHRKSLKHYLSFRLIVFLRSFKIILLWMYIILQILLRFKVCHVLCCIVWIFCWLPQFFKHYRSNSITTNTKEIKSLIDASQMQAHACCQTFTNCFKWYVWFKLN